jgi:beta-carotene 3-hydroxylase
MTILINILLVIVSFLAMEGVAWFSHKYIMHGFMWSWHESHHIPHQDKFEKNDLFSVVFSIPSISCFLLGTLYPSLNFLIYIGLGILAYGLFYLIFHDIIVHRRVKIKYMAKSAYMRRLIRAHKVHHKTIGKEGATSFGFLIASKKYDE